MMQESTDKKIYGAIDVGLKRIGLAYSPNGTMVFPLDAVMRKNRNQASSDTIKSLAEFNVNTIIVGLPKGGSSEEEMQRRIEHFVKLLEFEGEIEYQDEYGPSAEASELAKGVFKQKKDGKIDSLSAKLILERYLKIL